MIKTETTAELLWVLVSLGKRIKKERMIIMKFNFKHLFWLLCIFINIIGCSESEWEKDVTATPTISFTEKSIPTQVVGKGDKVKVLGLTYWMGVHTGVLRGAKNTVRNKNVLHWISEMAIKLDLHYSVQSKKVSVSINDLEAHIFYLQDKFGNYYYPQQEGDNWIIGGNLCNECEETKTYDGVHFDDFYLYTSDGKIRFTPGTDGEKWKIYGWRDYESNSWIWSGYKIPKKEWFSVFVKVNGEEYYSSEIHEGWKFELPDKIITAKYEGDQRTEFEFWIKVNESAENCTPSFTFLKNYLRSNFYDEERDYTFYSSNWASNMGSSNIKVQVLE